MAESVLLVAQPRQGRGTRRARRLREQGLIPAVVYGHQEPTVSVALPVDAVESAIRHGARVVDLQTEGTVQKALIKEVQWDYLGKEILHVDFARVAADERVRVTVRLELRGTALGVSAGGILEQPLHTVDVECLVSNVPESIRVNISELQLDQVLHVRHLTLPPDVTVLDDPDAVVVQVRPPEVEPEAAAAAEQAEPEVIGRARAEEEEEGE